MKDRYEHQSRYHERIKARGFIRRSYYAHPDDHPKIKELADRLKKEREEKLNLD